MPNPDGRLHGTYWINDSKTGESSERGGSRRAIDETEEVGLVTLTPLSRAG